MEGVLFMIKLIATDIDGTLVKDGTLDINPEYMEVIQKLIEKGITFVACSGRQYQSEAKIFAPIADKLLYVAEGGTVIRTPEKILKVHTISEDIWKEMCKMLHESMPECDYFIATPECSYAENENSQMFRWIRDSYGFDVKEMPDMMQLSGKQVTKFSVYHPTDCEAQCAPLFTPTWKDKVTLVSAGNQWMDSTAIGAGKGSAIAFLQEYLGISPEETCAFGDNLNDIEMLQNAGLSFAVSNAREEVRNAAKELCDPYWENGVLNVLKSFL